MNEEKFGNIVNNGKMIDIDKANVSELKTIATDLKTKREDLEKKVVTVFKQ